MKRLFLILAALLLSGSLFSQPAGSRTFLPPFNFHVDSVSLLATWEAPKIVLLDEDFEGAVFPPPGWADTTLGLGWLCEDDPQYNWWWIVPEHSGKQAQVNDDIAPYSNDGSMDFLFLPALDLTVADSFRLSFDSYFDGAYGQTAFVKYSVDDGATWQVLEKMDADLEWQKVELDLSPFSGPSGVSNFKLAFYTNDKADNGGWWASGCAIDNVAVYSDDIPGQLVGYEVFPNAAPVDTVHTTNYKYYFEYNSLHSCGITALYADGVSDTLWQEIRSYYLPEPVELSAYYYTYYYHANLKWYPPLGYQQEPPTGVTTLQGQDQKSSIDNRDVGEVLLSFTAPYPISSCQGICDDGYNLWVTDPDLSPTTIYQLNFSGELTGVEITVNQGQSWIGGMASYNNILYAILVGGPNAIVKIDLGTGETLATITGDWSVIPQEALTVDFKNHEFYIGGWSGDMIWRTDFNGVTISTHLFPEVGGLAWEQFGGPYSQGSLWVVESSTSTLVTELAPNYGWATCQSFQFPGGQPYTGAGAAISRVCEARGNLWLCDKINNTIYLVDLFEPWDSKGREYLPENLIGYNVYRNGGFKFFTSCTDPCWCNHWDDPNFKDSAYFKYEVSALFDLSPYGFPGDTGESLKSVPAVLSVGFFNELDFFEDWAPGSNNYWELNVNNWKIDAGYGNNAPAAVFKTNQVLHQYEQSLETWQIVSDGMPGDIILEYDVSLSSIDPSGDEKLLTEVYDYVNHTWNTVKTYTNLDGSFDWRRDTLNITTYFNDNHFKIRFNAIGENSDDIDYWAVDNISARHICLPPENVQATPSAPPADSVIITWDVPIPDISEWKQWDDGVHDAGIGFGTSKSSWFGAAAHWTPEMLVPYKGATITAIGFIPGDLSACFKVAIWSGENKTPVYMQASGNLIMNEWNIITLDDPYPIDITKDLYIGYKLSAYTGYPMSVDDGPAMNGFGNSFQNGPDAEWQTILDFNPDIDVNWNIKANFERDGIQYESYYNVFRSIDGSEPEMIAETMENEFMDPVSTDTGLYCYKLKALFYDGCESEFSPESCVLLTEIPIIGEEENGTVKIYPNPASEAIIIESDKKIESVRIFDRRGITIEQWNNGTLEHWNSGTLKIPVSGLAPGLYLVRVETESGVVGRKVVVRR